MLEQLAGSGRSSWEEQSALLAATECTGRII
jgi:hypothetical protein